MAEAMVYFDPEIGARERELLARHPRVLTNPCDPLPPPPSPLNRGVAIAVDERAGPARWLAPLLLFAFGLAADFGSRRLAGLQRPPVPGTYTSQLPQTLALGLAWVSWLALIGAMFAAAVALLGVRVYRTDARARRAAARLHGRYVLAGPLDIPAAAMLGRARRAAKRIAAASVLLEGCLDDVALRLTLDQFEWDLARQLAVLSHHRSALRSLPTRRGPGVRAAAVQISELIAEANTALDRQVNALVDLAAKIAQLAAAHCDAKAARELLGQDALVEIASARARDTLTLDAIAELSARLPWWRAQIDALAAEACDTPGRASQPR